MRVVPVILPRWLSLFKLNIADSISAQLIRLRRFVAWTTKPSRLLLNSVTITFFSFIASSFGLIFIHKVKSMSGTISPRKSNIPSK